MLLIFGAFFSTFSLVPSPKKAHAVGNTYYVDATGGLDTSNGLSEGQAWKTVTKVNGFAFVAGDTILFKGGETWATQLRPSVSGSDGNHIVFGAYNLTAGQPKLTAAVDANGKSYLTFNNLYITGARIWADSGESSIYFNNCIIENTGSYGFDGQTAQTDIRFNNCVFARNLRYHIDAPAGAVTVRNSIFLSNANTDEGVWNAGTSGTLDIDYSLINTAQLVSTTRVTDGGHNLWYPDPKITSYPTSITPRFTFTFDDTGSLDSFASMVNQSFDPYGVKGTIFVSPALMTAGNITTAQSLSAAGHEIANHTLNHEDLTATQAFVVTSTNTNATVDIDVPTTTITLWCDEVGNRVSLDWSSGTTIQNLKNAIVGKGWVITNSAQNSKTRQDTLLLDELADSGGAQAVSYTALLDISAPNYKFWDHEINGAQDAIQTITGIRPTTMAYPYGFNNAALITWMKANSDILSARKVSGAPTTLASISKFQFPQRGYGWSSTDSEETVRAWSRRIFYYAKSTPGYHLYYEHITTQAGWTRYGWMIDELNSLGATFNTYGQLIDWFRSDHVDTGDNWTKTYDVSGADYHLLSTSPAIGAASDGTDIGAYQYIPTVSAPTLSSPTTSSISLVLDADDNPALIKYAIYNETAAQYVQADGTLGAGAVWQTRTAWGGDSGITNTGLTANTSYTYKVKARGTDNVTETALSAGALVSTLANAPTATVQAADSIGQTTATLNGTITTVNGVNATERGFKVYNGAACAGGIIQNPHDTGNYGAGAFSKDTDIALTANTAYSYTAYAINAGGTGTSGTCETFTTLSSGGGSTPTPTPSPAPASSSIPTAAEIIETVRYYASTPFVSFDVPTSTSQDSVFTFDASKSFSTSDIVKYEWDFGDGETSDEMRVDHNYDKPGRYTVTLTVTDKAGKTSTKTQTVDVKPPKPTVENIKVEDNNLIIEGKAYPLTIVSLTIHSNPISADTRSGNDGTWSYTVANAREVLGAGDHTVVATDAFVLDDNTQLKSEQSKTYDFQLSLDGDKLKVEMGKTRKWQYISLGLVLLMIAGFLVLKRRRR